MASDGYAEAGYKYIFIDDAWQGGRDKRNNILPDPEKFPNGMKALADYVHSKGLRLGIYSDAALLTCAGYTASYGLSNKTPRPLPNGVLTTLNTTTVTLLLIALLPTNAIKRWLMHCKTQVGILSWESASGDN